ncbi:MAG: GumC family protein [Terriglobia bacterium]
MTEQENKLIRQEGGRLKAGNGRSTSLPTLLAGADEGEIHLRDYFRVVRKYRLTILLFVFVMVLTVAVVSLRMPKTYVAIVRLAIDKESPTSLVEENAVPADPWGFQDYLRTQIRVLQSDTLALRTARMLRLDREPDFVGPLAPSASTQGAGGLDYEQPLDTAAESRLIGILQGRLRVSPVPNSWLVEIRFSSSNPELAARIANAHANNFIEHNFRTRYEATTKASEWLSDQLLELRGKVERAERQLRNFERRYNLVSIDERQNVLTQRLADLNHELSVVESDRVAKQSLFQQGSSGQDAALLRDSLADTLASRLNELRTRHAESRTQFGPQHPRMLRLEEQIAEVEGQLARHRATLLAQLKSGYEAAVKRETLLRALVNRQKAQVNQLNQRLVRYNILKREAVTQKQLHEGLLQKLSEAGISAGLRSSNIRIIDPARVPLAPSSPNVAMNLLMAFFLSVPVGIALAFFREYFDNTVKTPDEVERYSGLPTLAVVPLAEDKAPGRFRLTQPARNNNKTPVALATYKRPQSGMAEAFRSLRTSVLLSFPERSPRLLLITSGQPLDGKTTAGINLAVALAQRGSKVLLVDADMRKPAIHRLLQINARCGLSLYLAGSQGRDGLILRTAVPKLSLLPAGPVPPNPAELLSSGRMESLLADLGQEFDHVIVDSPPVLSITDATVLSVMVDGVILVVRSGKTSRQVLRHARQTLQGVNACVLGVVLNGVSLNSVDYYYYYYKYYGYGFRHDRAR